MNLICKIIVKPKNYRIMRWRIKENYAQLKMIRKYVENLRGARLELS